MSSNKPFPSSDLDVFKENSLILDNFVNSQENEHPDRFARKRPTITGIIKEAFNVRTDISNMNETLIGQSRWDAVPKNTSLALGGDNGALNKQAQALFNRTELLKVHAREALRRSYAEAGYNLVNGGFEQGGTLNNQNDVLLQERTGKAFTGPAGAVTAGTDPAVGEFVDRSGDLTIDIGTYDYIRAYDGPATKLRALGRANLFDRASGMFVLDSNDTTTPDDGGVVLVGAGGRRWKRQITGIDVLPEWWGAKGDDINDDSDPLQSAINFSFNKQYRVLLSKGVYKTTKELLLTLGLHYSQPGLRITGAGKASSTIKLYYENTEAPISILSLTSSRAYYNLEISELGLAGTNKNAISACLNVNTEISGLQLTNLNMSGAITGVWLRKDAWINKFLSLFITTRDYGIRMDASGTTNTFDNCFVYGTNVCAYRLTCIYSTIGALAADNCIGIIYNLDYFSGSIGSLGSEFPVKGRTATTLLMTGHGDIHIDYLIGYLACPTDGTEFTAVDVGEAVDVVINCLVLSKNDLTDPNRVVNGRVVKGYRGSVTIHKLNTAGSLVFSAPWNANSPITLVPPTGTPFNITQDAKPRIGLGKRPLSENYSGVGARLIKRPLQNIYFDAAGGPNGSGVGENYLGDRDKWNEGAEQGSWMMEVDPALRGCAGYAVTATGIDMSSTVVARIPIVQTSVAYADLPTSDLWEGRRVFVRSVHKWVTYSAYDTAGWYDETGTKVV